MKNLEKLLAINNEIEEIIEKAKNLENDFNNMLSKVHPSYNESALNLIHYLAFRSFDIADLQEKLRYMALPDVSNIEGHVMKSLLAIKTIINHLSGNYLIEKQKNIISIKKSEKLLRKNTKQLFGYKSKKRVTRIMVTLPSTAAEDYSMISRLIKLGMNSARINCAHDSPEVWAKMIENIKRANKALKKNCKVMMDLGGPKLRTGSMGPGPKVVHLQPERDLIGKVTSPSEVWLAHAGTEPEDEDDMIIPVSSDWLKSLKKNSTIIFTDSRNKHCKLKNDKKRSPGWMAKCYDSAYVTTGTVLTIKSENEAEEKTTEVGEMLPLEEKI
ncbi:MAG: hypothetical protein KAI29_14205, partial [Cyclobacteriaceae bacterium]|nr:hypothetical protein [Cyclobacteriaceae bacterium]